MMEVVPVCVRVPVSLPDWVPDGVRLGEPVGVGCAEGEYPLDQVAERDAVAVRVAEAVHEDDPVFVAVQEPVAVCVAVRLLLGDSVCVNVAVCEAVHDAVCDPLPVPLPETVGETEAVAAGVEVTEIEPVWVANPVEDREGVTVPE